MKRILAITLALTLALGLFAAAGADELTDRPELKFLVSYRTFDPNADLAVKYMNEISGYNVVYEMLPQDNADEKLMLEMSAGTEYDIIELGGTMFGRLADLGVLTPLDDLLAQYGEYLLPAEPKELWDAAKNSSGDIVALVRQVGAPEYKSANGTRADGALFTKQEILDELGLTVPKTPAELTAFLQAIKDAKGVAGLTSTKDVMFRDILAGFDLAYCNWIEDETGFTHISEKPEFRDYIRYIADLYAKGLLDPDMPVNKGENKNQKFTTDGAYVAQFAFWEIPSLIPGLEASGLSTTLVPFLQPLADQDGNYVLVNRFGVNKYYGIPRVSKKADHAVNYFNIISKPENFIITHIGYEGTHYSTDENGNYWPIFPAFNDLNWANQFSGLQEVSVEYKQWQARARKTPEMAVAYDAIGRDLPNGIYQIDRASLCGSLPAVQANTQAANTLFSDTLLLMVVENRTSDEDFDSLTASYMAEGGAAIKEEMNAWAKDRPFEF
jgi:putative aldouronate transport system substrate-binding protein